MMLRGSWGGRFMRPGRSRNRLGGRRAEDGGRRTDDRRQKTEDGGLRTEDGDGGWGQGRTGGRGGIEKSKDER